jgi:hypothetical protein
VPEAAIGRVTNRNNTNTLTFSSSKESAVTREIDGAILKGTGMTKQELAKKIKEILKTGADLDFLLALKKGDLENLIACIRDGVDHRGEES